MGMEILHCQTVEGVQKELWMFLLIYNLIRAVMVAALIWWSNRSSPTILPSSPGDSPA